MSQTPNDKKEIERRENAPILLECMLLKQMPPLYILEKVYPDSHNIIPLIQKSLDHYNTTGFRPGKLRPHNTDAPNTNREKILRLSNDIDCQTMQDAICRLDTPPIKLMEKYYGKYTPSIIETDNLYYEQAIKSHMKKGLRQNLQPTPVHLNGTALLTAQIIPDKDHINTSAVRQHDVVEDLLRLLENYDTFINKYIHQDLQETVIMMTNHYHLILKSAYSNLKNNGLAFDKKNLLASLQILKIPNSLSIYVNNIINDVEKDKIADVMTTSEDYFGATKWHFYDKYMDDMATGCKRKKIFLPFEDKGCDLTYNRYDTADVTGIDYMKMNIKDIEWVNKGWDVKPNFKRLDDQIAEHGETALRAAEKLIIRTLLNKQAPLTNLNVAKKKIEYQQPVFYLHKKLIPI